MMMIIVLFQAIDKVPHTLLLNKPNNFDYLHLMLSGSKATYYIKKSKAVPLHAMEALGGRGGIAPTHSRPRH
jgi:hypothetical protein